MLDDEIRTMIFVAKSNPVALKTYGVVCAKSDPEVIAQASQESAAAIASNLTFYLDSAVEDGHQRAPNQGFKGVSMITRLSN